MDDIQKRLKETSEACIKSHEKWATNKKDSDTRGTLQEAIHELRKVASRLEIELAVSERDENVLKKIPIPSHRSAQGRGAKGQDNGNMVAEKSAVLKAPRSRGPKKPADSRS